MPQSEGNSHHFSQYYPTSTIFTSLILPHFTTLLPIFVPNFYTISSISFHRYPFSHIIINLYINYNNFPPFTIFSLIYPICLQFYSISLTPPPSFPYFLMSSFINLPLPQMFTIYPLILTTSTIGTLSPLPHHRTIVRAIFHTILKHFAP